MFPAGLGVVALAFDLSSQEAGAERSLWVWGQSGLYREIQNSQGYIGTPCLKTKQPQTNQTPPPSPQKKPKSKNKTQNPKPQNPQIKPPPTKTQSMSFENTHSSFQKLSLFLLLLYLSCICCLIHNECYTADMIVKAGS
jgi:outer membrane biosynthesis protein TonB